jgi:hypothetical protein
MVIERIANPDSTRVLIDPDDATLRAFLIRAPWGGAALIARKADDGIRLLDWRRRQAALDHPVFAGLPDGDEARRARLVGAGWTRAGAGTRMIRGRRVEWQPTWIWGNFSGALG